MIILDFDGVLFNDERFKRDYWRLFRRHGISHRAHQAAYAESKARHRGGYCHDLHLALIKKRVPTLPVKKVEQDIWKLLARSADYLYADALPFLRHWKSKNEQISLVSSGNAFQKRKVRAGRLSRFFLAVIVADTSDKVAPVRMLARRGGRNPVFFIDDKKSFTDAVKRALPDVFVIQLVRRRGEEQSTCADAIVRNLASARRIIAQEMRRRSGVPGR